MRNYIITGGSGYLATALTKYLLATDSSSRIVHLSRQQNVIFKSNEAVQWAPFEVSPEQLVALVGGNAPTAIFHLAAQTSPSQCEENPRGAWQANVLLTKRALALAAFFDCYLCFASTELIFSGTAATKEGGFDEASDAEPAGVYPRSKSRAEALILRRHAKSGIARISLMYGVTGDTSQGLIKLGTMGWMVDQLRTKTPLTLFIDEFRTPILVDDVAAILALMAGAEYRGVLHCGGPERLSRVDYGARFVAAFELPETLLKAVRREDIPSTFIRPADVSLNSTKMNKVFNFYPKTVDQGLELTRLKFEQCGDIWWR